MTTPLKDQTDNLSAALDALIGVEGDGSGDSLHAFLADIRSTTAVLVATRSILDNMGAAADLTGTAARIVDTTEEALELLSKLGGTFGTVVKIFGGTLERIETALDEVSELAGNVSDNSELLIQVIDILIDEITTGFEDPLVASIERAERLDDSVELIADVSESLTTATLVSQVVTGGDVRLLAAAEQLESFINGRLVGFSEVDTLLASDQAKAFGTAADIFDPLQGTVQGIASAFDQIAEINDKISFLEIPLDVVEFALSPIESLLDAVGFIFDLVVGPILNPVLEATGIQGLIDEIGDRLAELAPGADDIFFFLGDILGDAAMEALFQDGESSELPKPGSEEFSNAATGLASVLIAELAVSRDLGSDFTEALDTHLDAMRDEAGVASGDGAFVGDVSLVDTFNEELGVFGSGRFEGTAGDDIFVDDAGDATLSGGAGSDVFIMAAGDDRILGGEGAGEGPGDTGVEDDYAVFVGSVSAYSFGTTEDGELKIWNTRPVNGRNFEGNNTFVDVEQFQFADALVSELQARNVIEIPGGVREETGTEANDFILGNAAGNRISGGAGDDMLNGGGGRDVIFGGAGNDLVQVQDGFVFASGGEGQDAISFAGAREAKFVDLRKSSVTPLEGSSHEQLARAIADFDLGGETVRERLEARGDGDLAKLDAAISEAGTTALDVWYTEHEEFLEGLTTSLQIDLGDGAGIFPQEIEVVVFFPSVEDFVEEITGFEDVIGGDGNDTFEGSDVSNALLGNNGNDRLFGRGGDDVLNGGFGDDTLNGGSGSDVLIGLDGDDLIIGSLDLDTSDALFADKIDGGDGFDTLSFAQLTANLSVDMTSGRFNGIDGSEIFSIEKIVSGSGDDTILMSNGLTAVETDAGDDRVEVIEGGITGGLIETSGGNDTVTSGVDNDLGIDLGADDDSVTLSGAVGDRADARIVIQGGAGQDIADLSALSGGVLLQSAPPDVAGAALGVDLIGTITDAEDASAVLGIGGIETLLLSDADDAITGRVGHLTRVEAGEGDNLIDLSGHTLEGTEGVIVRINSGSGNDVIATNEGMSTHIDSGAGDDVVSATDGSLGTDIRQRFFTGDGNDVALIGDAFTDVHMGAGFDTADFSARSESLFLVMDSEAGNGTNLNGTRSDPASFLGTGFETNSGIEHLIATAQDDYVTAYDGAQVLDGGAGHDSLIGGAGEDILIGGDGDDELHGGTEDDVLSGGRGADSLTGGAGDDRLVVTVLGDRKTDVLDGEDGSDTLILQRDKDDAPGGAIRVDLRAGTVLQDGVSPALAQLANIENIEGSVGRDHLTGNLGDNLISGGAGDDVITGLGGHDLLFGGDGDDLFIADRDLAFASTAEARVDGGDGQDTLSFTGFNLGVSINLDTGTLDARTFTISSIPTPGSRALFDGNSFIDFVAEAIATAARDAGIALEAADAAALSALQEIGLPLGAPVVGQPDGDTLDALVTKYGADLGYGPGVFPTESDFDDTPFLQKKVSGIEHVNGSTFDDDLTGDAEANLLQGQSGDDLLQGGAGADTLDGGSGIDTATYAGSQSGVDVSLQTGRGLGGDAEGDVLRGVENLEGSASDDRLEGNSAGQVIEGGAGADTILGGGGADTLVGDDGDDVLVGTHGTQTLFGGSGDDVLDGVSGNDQLFGGDGDDLLLADFATDDPTVVYDGGAGFDTLLLHGNGGAIEEFRNDTITGIERLLVAMGRSRELKFLASNHDFDVIEATTADRDTRIVTRILMEDENVLDLGQTQYVNATAQDINVIAGESDAETVVGASIRDRMVMGGGDDVLFGMGGDDEIHGQDGSDTVDGGDGDDHIRGNTGNDALSGGEGDDFVGGDRGDDTISGAAGNDTLHGNDDNDVLRGGDGADSLRGGSGNDDLHGDDGDDFLGGDNGHDQLYGGAGADTLHGNDGNDVIEGGQGADVLHGGNGWDMLSYQHSSAGVAINFLNGGALFGDAAGDTFSHFENFRGSDFGDHFIGSNGHNYVETGGGNDFVSAQNGNDTIDGGAGNDLLAGGHGADRIIGGSGNDTALLGQDGNADTFVFHSGADEVQEFDQGEDRIEIDAALFVGMAGIETGHDVVDAFATLDGSGEVVNFDFGGGDSLRLIGDGDLSLSQLGASIDLI